MRAAHAGDSSLLATVVYFCMLPSNRPLVQVVPSCLARSAPRSHPRTWAPSRVAPKARAPPSHFPRPRPPPPPPSPSPQDCSSAAALTIPEPLTRRRTLPAPILARVPPPLPRCPPVPGITRRLTRRRRRRRRGGAAPALTCANVSAHTDTARTTCPCGCTAPRAAPPLTSIARRRRGDPTASVDVGGNAVRPSQTHVAHSPNPRKRGSSGAISYDDAACEDTARGPDMCGGRRRGVRDRARRGRGRTRCSEPGATGTRCRRPRCAPRRGVRRRCVPRRRPTCRLRRLAGLLSLFVPLFPPPSCAPPPPPPPRPFIGRGPTRTKPPSGPLTTTRHESMRRR